MKDNYINTLKSVCINLGLIEGKPTINSLSLSEAANWCLNTEGYVWNTYKPTVLKPILGTLKDKSIEKFIPCKSLTLENDALMPIDDEPTTELNDQFNKLKSKLQNANDDSLLMMLERHGSTLAVNKDFQDIPLYDFIKMTVGIALCLKESEEICLAGASISGIQSYLYDIVSKNAARLLKGRSFYLQLLADSLLAETIEQFDLSPCHVVYASGGNFYVLMPKNALTTEGDTFDAFIKTMSENIYEKHRFALFSTMAMTQFFKQSKAINEVWDELVTLLNKKKFKRLSSNKSIRKDFFKEFIEAGGTKTKQRDHITNEEFAEGEDPEYLYKNEDMPLSLITKQQIELGGKLRHSVLYAADKKGIAKTEAIIDPIGFKHYFWDKDERAYGLPFKTFNHLDSDKYDSILYGGNEVPIFENEFEVQEANDKEKKADSKLKEDPYKVGDIKPFEYLVGKGNLSRLAILRMDVDGLGAIFSEDIGTNQGKKNICRYAATSRSLDFFFKGYLNTLRKDYDDTVAIIYSGGDDLFIVGKWNDVFKLTGKINDDFKLWSCGNLTISGGAVLVPPKFPIMQSARLANVVEDKAKKHRFPSDSKKDKVYEKNAICLFDMPLNWDVEYPIVKKLYVDILSMIKSSSLSMSFINKIMNYAEIQKFYQKLVKYEKDVKEGKNLTTIQMEEYKDFKSLNLLRWKWNMAYDLTRFADNPSSARDKEAKDFVRLVIENAFANTYDNQPLTSKTEYHYLELLQMACRWAELEKRTQDEQNKIF